MLLSFTTDYFGYDFDTFDRYGALGDRYADSFAEGRSADTGLVTAGGVHDFWDFGTGSITFRFAWLERACFDDFWDSLTDRARFEWAAVGHYLATFRA